MRDLRIVFVVWSILTNLVIANGLILSMLVVLSILLSGNFTKSLKKILNTDNVLHSSSLSFVPLKNILLEASKLIREHLEVLRVQVVFKERIRKAHFEFGIFNSVYTEAWSVLGCGVVWYEVLPGAPAGCKLSCNWCCWAFALRQAMLSFLSCSVSWVAPAI